LHQCVRGRTGWSLWGYSPANSASTLDEHGPISKQHFQPGSQDTFRPINAMPADGNRPIRSKRPWILPL